MPTPTEIAMAFLDHWKAAYAEDETRVDETFPAWETVQSLIQTQPDTAWLVILELVNQAPNDQALAYVAAGPIEDLLKLHGRSFIDRVETVARQSERFREALTSVWIDDEDEDGVKRDVKERLTRLGVPD